MPLKSSPTPQRRTGTRRRTFVWKASVLIARSVMAVAIQPGSTELTRMPWRACSTARPRTIALSPALVDA